MLSVLTQEMIEEVRKLRMGKQEEVDAVTSVVDDAIEVSRAVNEVAETCLECVLPVTEKASPALQRRNEPISKRSDAEETELLCGGDRLADESELGSLANHLGLLPLGRGANLRGMRERRVRGVGA